MTWPKMLKLDEDKLQEMGMGALGARYVSLVSPRFGTRRAKLLMLTNVGVGASARTRRKLLKAIESVANGEPVSPTGAKF